METYRLDLTDADGCRVENVRFRSESSSRWRAANEYLCGRGHQHNALLSRLDRLRRVWVDGEWWRVS